jgi:uncharacterized protein YuzE
MKLHSYPDTDSLYTDLSSAPGVDSLEISEDLATDYDENARIVGVDIQHASLQMNLTSVQLEHLPLSA